MSDNQDFQANFQVIAASVRELMEQAQGDPIALLQILRFLEKLHNEIRETHFQPAIPIHRHGLYALLREMESEGGWPYIPRMQLKALLYGNHQPIAEAPEEESNSPNF